MLESISRSYCIFKNKSNVYDSYDDFIENIDKNENFVFILSVGVFIKNNPSIAMIKQLNVMLLLKEYQC